MALHDALRARMTGPSVSDAAGYNPLGGVGAERERVQPSRHHASAGVTGTVRL